MLEMLPKILDDSERIAFLVECENTKPSFDWFTRRSDALLRQECRENASARRQRRLQSLAQGLLDVRLLRSNRLTQADTQGMARRYRIKPKQFCGSRRRTECTIYRGRVPAFVLARDRTTKL